MKVFTQQLVQYPITQVSCNPWNVMSKTTKAKEHLYNTSCYQTDTTQGGSFWRDPFMWGACFHCGYIVGTLSVWYSRLGAFGLKGSWPLRLYPTVAYMYHCDRGKLSRQKTFANWWFWRRKLLACAVPKEATPANFTEKTFVNGHKTVKFAKVFTLKSFPLYIL